MKLWQDKGEDDKWRREDLWQDQTSSQELEKHM